MIIGASSGLHLYCGGGAGAMVSSGEGERVEMDAKPSYNTIST